MNLINWIIVEGSEHTELGYKQFMGEIFGDNILFSDGKYIYIFIIYDSDKPVLQHYITLGSVLFHVLLKNMKMPPLLVKCCII